MIQPSAVVEASRRDRGLRRGFTLLELIVVITIIGILGTMVVVRVTVWADRARITKIKADVKAIYEAAQMWQVATGGYPTSLEELKSGKTPTGEEIQTVENAKDPWNNDYIFETGSDGKPRVRCLGKDGVEGGEAENKDYEFPEAGGQ